MNALVQAPEAQLLLHFVADSGQVYMQERSVKFCAGQLLDERFLFSLGVEQLGDAGLVSLKQLAGQLNIPRDYWQQFVQLWHQSDVLHLGFEQGPNARHNVCKFYLEQAQRFGAFLGQTEGTSSDPFLLHQAFKWQIGDPEAHAKTEYWCSPGLSRQQVNQCLRQIYPKACKEHELIARILDRAESRCAMEDLFFMEVIEQDNPRRSFDINLYDCGLKVKDLLPELEQLCECYVIPDQCWQQFVETSADQCLGHVSAGLARDGQPFVTVYFGAEMRGG